MFEDVSEAVSETIATVIENLVRIPMVGTIAAGQPIDLPDTAHGLYDEEDMVDVSPAMLRGDTSQLFALTVKGRFDD